MITARVLPDDPGLPALAELFPAKGCPDVAAELADAAPESAVVDYVRYRPGRSCVVLWSLPTSDGRPLHLYGKLVAQGRAAAVERRGFRELASRAEALAGPGRRLHRFEPGLGLLLVRFPFDPRLRGLPLATSRTWVRERVAPCLGVEGTELEAFPLSYKPERRCVVRYERAGGDGRVLGFAKLFRDERGQGMLPRLRSVAAQLRERSGAWEIVSPLAHLPEAHLLLLPALEGGDGLAGSLQDVVDGRSDEAVLLGHVARAARGLGDLQRCAVDGLPVVAPPALVAKLRRGVALVRCVEPPLADSLEARVAALERRGEALAPEARVPTHGAFRHGQLLLRRDGLVVLDLDTLCRSGASADAGNFVAYLDFLGLRRPRLASVTERCREAFVAALDGPPGSRAAWLAWYRAASHLKVALRSYLSLSRRWPEHTAALLGCADRALAGTPRC